MSIKLPHDFPRVTCDDALLCVVALIAGVNGPRLDIVSPIKDYDDLRDCLDLLTYTAAHVELRPSSSS